jgi:hypothetical protein
MERAVAAIRDAMPRLAYVICDARVVFTVDLEADAVVDAELYAESLALVDTGLSFEISAPRELVAPLAQARQAVERDPRSIPLRWSDEGEGSACLLRDPAD